MALNKGIKQRHLLGWWQRKISGPTVSWKEIREDEGLGASGCVALETANGDVLHKEAVNALPVFASTPKTPETGLKQTRQSEIPRKETVSERGPWIGFISGGAVPVLAVPVLAPNEDDENKRQTEAEPQTMNVHEEPCMYIVGRLNTVTSGQSVDLALGGAGRGLLLVPYRTTLLLSTL